MQKISGVACCCVAGPPPARFDGHRLDLLRRPKSPGKSAYFTLIFRLALVISVSHACGPR